MLLFIILASNFGLSAASLMQTNSFCIAINKCKHFGLEFDRVMEGVVTQTELMSITCGFDYARYIYKGNSGFSIKFVAFVRKSSLEFIV